MRSRNIRKIVAVILCMSMNFAQYAGAYDFVQTDWSGGTSASTASHPGNQTGWSTYSSKDAQVSTVGGEVKLIEETRSVVDTTDGDFTAGTRTGVSVSGTGTAASLIESSAFSDPFATDLDQWQNTPSAPKMDEQSVFLFVNGYLYAFWNGTVFGRMDPATQKWAFLANTPHPFAHGASLCYPGSGDYIYATRGAGTRDFWRYSISGDSWEELADLSYNVGAGGSTASPGDGYVYCLTGNKSRTFVRYDIDGGTWENLADIIQWDVGAGGSLVYPGSGDYLYAIQEYIPAYNARYAFRGIGAGSWSAVGNKQTYVQSLVYPGTGTRMYATREYDNATAMHYMDIGEQVWRTMGRLPANVRKSYVFYPGAGSDFKFISISNPYELFDLDPARETTADAFDLIESPTDSDLYQGSRMIYDGSGNIYVVRHYSTYGNYVYKYDIAGKTWTTLNRIPDGLNPSSNMDVTYHAANNRIYALLYQDSGLAEYNPATDQWDATTYSDPPETVEYGAITSAGSLLYVLRGTLTQRFWQFNPSTNVWTDLANAPEVAGDGAALCYPGSGDYIYAVKGNHDAAFWRYSISGNTWTALADTLSLVCTKADLVYPGSGDYLYLGNYDDRHCQFMRYNMTNDSWEMLAPLPATNRYSGRQAMTAVGNTVYYCYFGTGQMYRYDIPGGTWEPTFHTTWDSEYYPTRFGSTVYAGGRAYLFYGGYNTPANHAWAYNVASGKWDRIVKVPFYMGRGTKACYPGSGNYIYVAQGRGTNKFWRYDYVDDVWDDAGVADAPYYFWTGAQLAGTGSVLYAMPGRDFSNPVNQESSVFLSYNINNDQWSARSALPASLRSYNMDDDYEDYFVSGNTLTHVPSLGRVYWRRNYYSAQTYYYDIAGNSWVSVRDCPISSRAGIAFYYPGSGNYIYFKAGDGSPQFYRYVIGSDQWEELSRCPFNDTYSSNDGDMFYPGNGDYLYVMDGYMPQFSRYSLSTGTWDMASYGSYTSDTAYGSGTVAFDGKIYTGSRRYFNVYDADTNVWSSLSAPYNTTGMEWEFYNYASGMAWDGDNYIYATRQSGENSIGRYNIRANAWQPMPTNFSFGYGHDLVFAQGKLYALRAGYNTAFAVFDPDTMTWSGLPGVPYPASFGADMEYPGYGDFIYVALGNNSTYFYKYSITNASWSPLANTPVPLGGMGARIDDNDVGYGGASICYPDRGDYIYMVPGSMREATQAQTSSLFRYSISNDLWEEIAHLPSNVGVRGGVLAYPGGDYLYYRPGDTAPYFYKYRIFNRGSYVSAVKEIGANNGFATAGWSKSGAGGVDVKVRTSISASMLDATAWESAGALTNGQDMSTAASVTDGQRYLQYRIDFFSDDLDDRATVDDITLRYTRFPSEGELISNIYNSGQARNRLMALTWGETVRDGTDVKMQLRTSSNGTDWSEWMGPSGTTMTGYDFAAEGDYAFDSHITLTGSSAVLTRELGDFRYKQAVIVDNAGQAAITGPFVAEVRIGAGQGAFWTNVREDGADIRFFDGTNKLEYNLSYFDYAKKTATVKVKIPSINAGEQKTIYLLYGSADASSESDASIGRRAGVSTVTHNLNPQPAYIPNRSYVRDTYWDVSNLFDYFGYPYVEYAGTQYPIDMNEFGSTGVVYDLGDFSVRVRIEWPCDNVYRMIVEGDAGYDGQEIDAIRMYGRLDSGSSTQVFEYTDSFFGDDYRYWVTNDEATAEGTTGVPQLRWLVMTGDYRYQANAEFTTNGAVNYKQFLVRNTQLPVTFFICVGNTTQAAWETWLDSELGYMSGERIFRGSTYIPVVEETATSPTLGASWPYREKISMVNAGAVPLSDYVVELELGFEHRGFWQHAAATGNDIRIVAADNTTVLAHRLVSIDTVSRTAVILVKVPNIPVGETTAYLYYGNASAASTSVNTVEGGFVPQTLLEGWWRFDENSGTAVSEEEGRLPLAELVDMTWVEGKFGSAIDFNSDISFVSMGDIMNDVIMPLTLSAWVKWDGGQDSAVIVTDDNPDCYSGSWILINANGSVEVGFGQGYRWGYDSDDLRTRTTAAGAVLPGTWTHICGVIRDATDIRVFINGVESGQTYYGTETSNGVLTDPAYAPLGNANFGWWRFSTDRHFPGTLDNVAIYNRALTDEEAVRLGKAQYGDRYIAGFDYNPTANTYAIGSYVTSNPVIQPVVGAFYDGDLDEFQETATIPAGSAIRYQCSADGYHWYYYTAGTWTEVSGGYSQTNTAAEVDAALGDFMSQVAGTGEFFFRAYLHSDDGAGTPQLNNINISTTSGTSFYLASDGSEPVNQLHTDAVNDRYFQYRMKLYSLGTATPVVSDVDVEYDRAYITLVAPDGGEAWEIGSSEYIFWNRGGLTDVGGVFDETVRIEYSTDGGATWKLEAANAPNTGSYEWTIDDDHTAQARVRISSNGWPVISDSSAANFRIHGSVDLTSPDGGERWVATSERNITWTSAATIPQVKLEYSINNGGSWNPVAESEGTPNDGIVTNDGSFTWSVPDIPTPSSSCLVRVCDPVDTATTDQSAAAFRIVGELAVTAPAADARLRIGNTYTLSWTTVGNVSTVNLAYSIDGGTTWRDMTGAVGTATNVANNPAQPYPSTTMYDWSVPDTVSETAIFRVSDSADASVYAESGQFSIRSFELSAPNGGEHWERGYTHAINWTSGGTVTPPIRIWYSSDAGATYNTLITTRSTDTGTFNWFIDQGVFAPCDNNALIRIVDSAGRWDDMDAMFSIMPTPAITVTSPAGGEEWLVGTSHAVTWTVTGDVSTDLAIEYSVEGGAWTSVAPVPTAGEIAAGSYAWTIPDALSTDVRLRVREVTPLAGRDTAAAVVSNIVTFAIDSPTITIDDFPADTVWVAGDTARSMTFSYTGTLIDPLTLEYSADGGAWTAIETFNLADHDGSYTWTNIPAAAAGTSVLLRLHDSRAPTAVSDSSNAITILPHQRITLTAPAAGAEVIQGDFYTVTWNWDGQATTGTLVLRLSTDGGATWPEAGAHYIDDNIPNSPNSYSWFVPSSIETDQARLRIYDANDDLVTSTTGIFSIALPVIDIVAPAAGDTWYATGAYNIRWQTTGSVSSNLSVQYRMNGGVWTPVSPAPTAQQISNGSYAWTVPDSPGSSVEVRITDNNRAEVTDTAGPLTIVAPSVTITTPDGSETGAGAWVVGTQHDIAWTSAGGADGAINSLRLQYTTDGATFTTIDTVSDQGTIDGDAGTYTWTIPDAVSSTVRVRIFDPARPATTVTSSPFQIAAPSMTITSPDTGSENWIIGTDHEITWYSVGEVVEPLKLYYTTDGSTWTQIAGFDGVNDGSYTWTVPDAYAAGTARIRIDDSYATPRSDLSDRSFTIGLPVITVATPSELWSATDNKTITWATTGTIIGPLEAVWTLNDFAAVTMIDNTIAAGATSVSWTIPEAAVGTTVRVRITDLGRPLVAGRSNDFTVLPVPAITITSPDSDTTGADGWRIGQQYTIEWTDNGGAISNNLRLRYSLDGGVSWADIASSVPNSGSYIWLVPLAASPSTTAVIRIYDNVAWKSGSNLSVDSEQFEIAIPQITVLSPAAGTIWAVGDQAPVTWSTVGFINNNLSIQYSTDGGVSYLPAASGESNDGTYTWTVPDVSTANARIKVQDAGANYGGQIVVDESEPFTIIPDPTITLTSPNGGEVYVLGNSVNITWSSVGLQVQNVMITYSADNFVTSRTIADSTPNDGSYVWTLPMDALSGATIKMRISMVGRPEIRDDSNGNFRIRGGFQITSPAAGGRFIVGRSETITWETRGTIAAVKVLYSSDGGGSWTTLDASAENTQTYAFTVPQPRSTHAMIRIEDVSDSTVYAESAEFTADYFTVTWRILDADTYSALSELKVRDSVWEDYPAVGTPGTINPPVTHDYPYASYTTFWAKEGYIERSTQWTADDDKTVTVLLENEATANMEWRVIVTSSYTAVDDTLSVAAWLEKKGRLVEPGESSLLRSATVEVYDGSTLLWTSTTDAYDSRGVFRFNWEDTGMAAGRSYFVKATIQYYETEYTSGASVDVTAAKNNYIINQTLSSLDTKTTAIGNQVEEAKTEIRQDTAEIKATAAETKDRVETVMKSEILNRQNNVKSGESILVRYRTYSGLSPRLALYSPTGSLLIGGRPMLESGGEGIYSATVTFLESWGTGDFTIVCSESTKGTMDAMVISVYTTDLESLSADVSAVLGTTSGISELEEVATDLEGQMAIMETSLNALNTGLVDQIAGASEETSGGLTSMYEQLLQLSERVKDIGTRSGVDFEGLYKITEQGMQDVDYLKNKTQELKAAIEMSRKMISSSVNKPVVHVWYEYE